MNINSFYLREMPVPPMTRLEREVMSKLTSPVVLAGRRQAVLAILAGRNIACYSPWAVTQHEQMRLQILRDVVAMTCHGLDVEDVKLIFVDSDRPLEVVQKKNFIRRTSYPKGFWRIDRDKVPELRRSLLTIAAFNDVAKRLANGVPREQALLNLLTQNDGEGWQLPETLRLADYGLGHDERAKEHQPVRECFGPRLYDWQLAQTPEESWAECHLHARNLLGQAAYEKLVAGDSGLVIGEEPADYQAPATEHQPSPEEPFQLTGEPRSSKRRKH
jgi:hypothetical protein